MSPPLALACCVPVLINWGLNTVSSRVDLQSSLHWIWVVRQGFWEPHMWKHTLVPSRGREVPTASPTEAACPRCSYAHLSGLVHVSPGASFSCPIRTVRGKSCAWATRLRRPWTPLSPALQGQKLSCGSWPLLSPLLSIREGTSVTWFRAPHHLSPSWVLSLFLF